tara:strand:- start:44 stop:1072 length:1029 start_codon:yes stop_codon:yes gene_type:complete
MPIPVKDAKSIDPTLFPKPNYSHIGNGNIIVEDPIFIPFDQILIPEKGNRARKTEPIPTSERITRIKNSFAPGVHTSEFLPAVIRRNVDPSEPLQYELLYGIGRTWTFQTEMGVEGYWFNVISASDTDLEWVCLNENEELEKSPNREKDVVESIIRMVKNGGVPSTQKKIDEAIRKNLPYRRSESRNRIVAEVCEGASVPRLYYTYTEGTAWKWIKDNSAIEWVIGGKWDAKVQAYGHLVKAGTVQHFFHKAIMKYAETGKPSYAIMHYELPTENSTFSMKHQAQYDVVERYHDAYSKLGMNTRSFMSIKGAMPQDSENHAWKYLVPWPKASAIARALKLAA